MKFNQDFIEKVTEANNIVDVISQYTQLKHTGSGLMGRCPFPDHPEKTPSFSVSEAKQVYHCFGCHKKGNIFTFLKDYQGMNFPDAVEFLAGRANIPMPEFNKDDDDKYAQVQDKKKQLYKVNQIAMNYFIEQLRHLTADHPVKKYIQKRGLSQEVIETFGVGYANADWDGLEKRLLSQKIPLELAEEARLVKARTGGKSGYFDLFRDRLMFPITTPMGEAVAFGGRIIEQGEPKYLNSPETPVFIKGRILYGLQQTAKYIRAEDSAIIVEGYMDLVSLYQAGIRHVVATMGTALTADHGKLLKRITKNVITLFDGDSAGIEAAERSLPILLAADLYPKGFILPNGMDPDDFVKAHGSQTLMEQLKSAPDLLVLVVDRWMQDYRGEASEKIKLCDRLKPLFAVIPDPRLRDLYLSEVAVKMGVGVQWLKSAVTQYPSQGANFSNAPIRNREFEEKKNPPQIAKNETKIDVDEKKIALKKASKAELLLLSLVLKNRANFGVFLGEEMLEQIVDENIRRILVRAVEVYRQDPLRFDKLTSLLVTYVDAPELLFMADTALPQEGEFIQEAEDKLLRDCMKRVKSDFLKAQAKQLVKELKSDGGAEKLEQIMNVQRTRVTLNKENK